MATIRNLEALTSIFGEIPSFHDAEVISLNIDRVGTADAPGPALTIKVYVFETTGEVDDRGYFRTTNDCIVTMCFTGVESLDLGGFNEQNVLFDMAIVDITDRQLPGCRFEVMINPSFGLGAQFQCYGIVIQAVESRKPKTIRDV